MIDFSKILVLIPARGGSKGIPRKNIKLLDGKPLIAFTIEAALNVFPSDCVWVSTENEEISKVCKEFGANVIDRPSSLATDTATTEDVIKHALKAHDRTIDILVLLQPTSPFRNSNHIQDALALFSNDIDMVVSVKKTSSNPYYVLFEENETGYLEKSKKGNFNRRQDCPEVWEFNGAIYVINNNALMLKSISNFTKINKYVMNSYESIDIDEPLDWLVAEQYIKLK
jgi:CMP-N,N'-diacetyllegionaminic acid synthase